MVLSCIIFEIKRDVGLESTRAVRGFPSEYCHNVCMQKN